MGYISLSTTDQRYIQNKAWYYISISIKQLDYPSRETIDALDATMTKDLQAFVAIEQLEMKI